MDDLIERLRAATMGFDWSDLPDDAVIPAVPLLREAATALSQEREERDEWQRRAERAENALPGEVERRAHVSYVIGLEASLAEAKRLLTKIAAPMEMRSSLWTKIGLIKAVQHFQKEAARFLSQEQPR